MLSHLVSLSVIEVSLFFYFVGLRFEMTACLHALVEFFFNGILYQYKLKYGCDEMIEGIGHICVPTNCLVFWN